MLGPFVYSDGSFELLSKLLARAAFAPTARRWHTQFQRLSESGSTAEDPLVGAVVYEESVKQQLPTVFYALRPWRHNRFWVDLREPSTLPDATTLSVRVCHPPRHTWACSLAAQAVPPIPLAIPAAHHMPHPPATCRSIACTTR